jgi:hypothetical protein
VVEVADPTTVVVDLLACARLTRLVTRDRVTKPWRRRLIAGIYQRAGGTFPEYWDANGPTEVTMEGDSAPVLAYLLSCDWCVSVYAGVFVVAARRVCPWLWDPIARALAASQATGIMLPRS